MTETRHAVLIANDAEATLAFLKKHLQIAGYQTFQAHDGRAVWKLLQQSPDLFDAILIDWLLPEIDGIELLAKIKEDPALKTLPVIMITAKNTKDDVLKGLQAGVYYFLTKPVDKNALLAILHTAVSDYDKYRALKEEVQKADNALSLMTSGYFEFQTLEDARILANTLAKACPQPGKAVIGLSELLVNAIEHGNLGISYAEKSNLNDRGEWLAEVQRRLLLPENQEKRATVKFLRTAEEVRFAVQDDGDGFDWHSFIQVDHKRLFHNHGRGIAMASAIGFDSILYQGKGNEVVATVSLAKANQAANTLEAVVQP